MDIVEIKKEKHSYNGIEFFLILNGLKGQKYKNKEDVNKFLWWVVEPRKKDDKLVENSFSNFLWYDTRGMESERIKDKYHQCNLVAMEMINVLLGGNFFSRIKEMLKEIKSMAICERIIFFKRIKYLWVNGLRGGKKKDVI